MSDQPNKFYLTTPIYYVNARPHIGHAYTTIVADVLARQHRQRGDDTFFLTGTDEHGQKIERSALAAGVPPQEFTDQVSAQFKALWDRMGLTYNRYIRTTDDCHKRGVQHLFRTLYEKGFIYLDKYTGAYCVSDEAFVDAPVGTPCPDCGRTLEEVTEENFFFKLSAFQEQLLDLIESSALAITPATARNEVRSFVLGNAKPIFDEAIIEQINAEFDWTKEPDLIIEPSVDSAGDRPLIEPAGPDHLALEEALVAEGKLQRRSDGALCVPGALKDLSISRSSFTWGIPVPDDILQKEGATQKHVVYVWLDALANYMTAVGYGSDDPKGQAEFAKYWPADLHLVGKEITRFHCVYWPAFLMAAGIPTPKAITANGWLLFDNAKMSKSRGNVVRSETILEAFGTLCPPVFIGVEAQTEGHGFSRAVNPVEDAGASAHEGPGSSSGLQPAGTTPPEKGALAPGFRAPTRAEKDHFAADVLRYFLLREIPFGQDGSFSFDAMVTRYNADLANGYGNLVSRTLSMIEKYFDGEVPTPVFEGPAATKDGFNAGVLGDAGNALLAKLAQLGPTDFSTALTEIAAFITITDGFITANAPWKLAKDPDNFGRLATVLYVSAEAVRWATAALHAYCPFVTAKVWAQLGLGSIEEAATSGELGDMHWGGLAPGTKLGTLGPVLPRADKGLADLMIEMENPTPAATAAPETPASAPAPSEAFAPNTQQPTTNTPETPVVSAAPAAPADASPQIAIDDFIKVELRIAQITLAERIPKADKLLRLEVSLGDILPPRQILSGIAEWYTPEELIGRRILIIANLAPRKMRGLESHGMLLAASEEGGKPFLATVPEGVPVGTRLK
ncbi:methionyl-tRNA synthetase [Bryocella elongata]|uniref:Methionine--tRNA ligase n=1 Tax=Bryocella elongata TaxID=863522 RepID=A0A1H5SCQ9_9BACT|nr:methionine--tRNA ligase subunit beta [Bryocella elongata]SEF48275.1 methionyl-tRNA synthetase [Bryocella elongata]